MSVDGIGSTEQLRRANVGRLLRSLRDDGPTSRAGLSMRTGLAKATVGTITADLVARGVVAHAGPAWGDRGRPAQPLTVAGSRVVAVGVEVNVDYVSAVVADLAGERVLVESRATVRRETGVVDDLGDLVRDTLVAVDEAGLAPLGIGVAVPGVVDREAGVVAYAPNLAWTDLDLARAVTDHLGPRRLSVRVENDANAAAVAEVTTGAAAGASDAVYVTGTVGIGAGVVVSGRVVRGARGAAGEVGHLQIGPSSARCACGRGGCWEAMVGLDAMLRETGVEVPDGLGGPVAVAQHVASVAASDPDVAAALEGVGRWVGRGVALLAHVSDPAVVVLGGYFVPLGRWILPGVESVLAADAVAARCRVAFSGLGIEAAAQGAAALVVDDLLEARLALP